VNEPGGITGRMGRHLTMLLFAMLCCNGGRAQHASLDIANCPIGNVQCVRDLKDIRALQLQVELNELYVASCRRIEAEVAVATSHRMSTLWAQYVAGWMMLILGIAIILAGLCMSWLQMSKGLRDGADLGSAFEVGPGGLKIRSPVVGLLVFAASIYFFSIYIDKVYRITDTLSAGAPENAKGKQVVAQSCGTPR
jgi:hypothetical protein